MSSPPLKPKQPKPKQSKPKQSGPAHKYHAQFVVPVASDVVFRGLLLQKNPLQTFLKDSSLTRQRDFTQVIRCAELIPPCACHTECDHGWSMMTADSESNQ